MADYTKIAFGDIRNFLWAKLKEENILDENDYYVDKFNMKMNPIIPSQQIPEFQNLLPGVPYIVYDIEVTNEYGEQFWINEEIASLVIIANDYQKIYEITELIKDLFKRWDVSAGDVNAYTGQATYNFLKIHLQGSMSPSISGEGDIQFGTVEIMYCYTREIGAGYRVQ
jgi:hypothetical protein